MIKYVNHDLETFGEKLEKIEKAYQRGIITREEYADKVNELGRTIKCTYNRLYGKEV